MCDSELSRQVSCLQLHEYGCVCDIKMASVKLICGE